MKPILQTSARAWRGAGRRQAGFTLIELMVALSLGILVVGAAVAALMVARQGFNSVDGGSQVRENARFAASIIERVAQEAGFVNVADGYFPTATQSPPLRGYDNATVSITAGSAVLPTYPTGGGVNGSDVLVVTFYGSSTGATGGNPAVLPADGSMINCAGIAEPQNSAQPATAVFHVLTSTSGEPTLACTYRDPATGFWNTTALVQGVESLQILYGTDGVTPNAVPAAITPPPDPQPTVPMRYLRASQLDVAGNLPATLDNWRRVRSIRVGMVVRGPASSVADRAATARTWNVLGAGFSDANDVGADLVIGTPDGRLRQQLVFTVHLRNTQNPVSLLQ